MNMYAVLCKYVHMLCFKEKGRKEKEKRSRLLTSVSYRVHVVFILRRLHFRCGHAQWTRRSADDPG